VRWAPAPAACWKSHQARSPNLWPESKCFRLSQLRSQGPSGSTLLAPVAAFGRAQAPSPAACSGSTAQLPTGPGPQRIAPTA